MSGDEETECTFPLWAKKLHGAISWERRVENSSYGGENWTQITEETEKIRQNSGVPAQEMCPDVVSLWG